MENPKEKRFCGSGRILLRKNSDQYAGMAVSICLDDFLATDITTGNNGKRYVRFILWPKPGGKDQYGNDHYAVVDEKKDAAPLKATPQVGGSFAGNDIPPAFQSPDDIPNF